MTLQGKIPDGIIRAYRKAIRIKEECPDINDNTDAIEGWAEGVKWELEQLYPDLIKLPKEE